MNDELQRLYQADVWEHQQGYASGSPEYLAMRERDRQRRARADQLIDMHALIAPEDYFHAARLFQHGDMLKDAWKAHTPALTSAGLGYRKARWMAAAAYDRWLMYQGKPQKYGTQYVSDGRRQRLWDVDPATLEEERAAWDVPPLAEQLRKAEEATRAPIPRYPSTSKQHRSGSEQHSGAGNRKIYAHNHRCGKLLDRSWVDRLHGTGERSWNTVRWDVPESRLARSTWAA